MCAGFGTRLKPLTDEVPKPAIPFMGRPMVWYALNRLKSAGITQIAANVHHLPDKMISCLETCASDLGLPQIAVFREQNGILGTGGGARACMKLLPDSARFVIYHGDVICNADISEAVCSHIESGCDISLVVAPRTPGSKLGMVGVDNDNHIVCIRDWFRKGCNADTPFQPCCFTGIHIVERHILESLPENTNICMVTEVYRTCLEKGIRIHACHTSRFFADIGTPQTYIEARDAVIQNPLILPDALIPDDGTDLTPVQIRLAFEQQNGQNS